MNNELKKTLGLSAALSTVIGVVIGSGVFFKPQAIYTATNGGPGLGMIAWVIGGIITITAGLTAAEVSAAIPKTGGMMVYIEEIYGKKLGFLTGWMQTVLFFPGTIAALAVIFAKQILELLGYNPNANMIMVLVIAIVTILFIAFLNTVGSSLGGVIQTVATVGKLVPLIVIIIFGFIKGNGNPILQPLVGPGATVGGALGQVLIATLFAYDGWINVGAAATAPAALVAERIFGNIGGKIVTVGILISVFGALNGYLLTGPRVAYTLAVKKTLPFSNGLAKLNKGGVPSNSIWLIAILASLYALTGQFNLLTDLTVFTIWIFYVLTFIGVIKLRKEKPDLERPYKVPLYPIIPAIAIIGGLFVIINQLLTATLIALGGIIITLIGIPVYSITSKNQ